ncbi:MAG TPA: hypothetical protein VL501_06160 [Pyrinomonadaceae bacterium]|jgi:hypothetical protein|nr:hypothetical protein [Pyrinomonadaceae bacterium]
MRPNLPQLIFAGLLGLYFIWIAYDPMQGSFLDNVDLPIHETGHLIFRLFGEFMMVAGGSLFQVIVPAIFVGYFLWRRQYYAASIVGMWVGQSILNVWVYAADAVKMQLVLTSGFTGSEGSFHDWNYLLERTGLLNSTNKVAGLIRVAGTLTIIASAAAAVCYSFRPEPAIDDE